jgi:hypothetical protein
MGNSLSLSGTKEITGKQLQLSSKEISTMSSELFLFMYSSWKPKDVWDIAEHPDKYVIAISDMITTQFHVLGYKTRDKRMGEIYFRKWDDLEPPMGSETEMSVANSRNDRSLTNIRDSEVQKKLKIELSKRKSRRRQRAQSGFPIHKQNAEIIAFYFVRIFQILGAMLLVVKDIELPEYDEETGALKGKGEPKVRNFAKYYPSQVTVPGFRPGPSLDDRRKLEYAEAALRLAQEKKGTTETPSTMSGGGKLIDTSTPLGPYEFLRYYLRKIDDNDKLDFKNNGIPFDKVMTSVESQGKTIYLIDKSRLLFFRYTLPKDADAINLKNGIQQEFGLPVRVNNGTDVEIKFIKVKIDDIFFNDTERGERGLREIKGYSAPSKRGTYKKDVFPTDVIISYERSVGREKSAVELRIDEKATSSPDTGIPYFIYKTENNLLDNLKSKYDEKEEFNKFLEEITLFYLVRLYPNIRLIKLKETFDAHTNTSDKNDESPLSKLTGPSNKSLQDVFKAIKPDGGYRPHCVARALQLLDPASIDNFALGSAVSNICKSSLGNSKEAASLSKYVPTRSLGQLYGKVNPTDYVNSMKVLSAFVQKDSVGNPMNVDDVSKFPGEKDDLQAAIQRLMKAYNPENTETVSSFDKIVSNIPKACGTKDSGNEIKIVKGSQEFRDMKSASQQLLAYHLKSIIEISKFLKKIFNISQRGDGSWKVEGPKVELLFAGYDTLNTLTNQARTILIDYYAGCEEIYQKGVTRWSETRQAAVDTSQGKEGAVIPSAPKPTPVPVDPSVKPVPSKV